MNIILPQKDKVVFRSFPVWLNDLENLTSSITKNVEDIDIWVKPFNLLSNQLSLLMLILESPEQSKEICDLSIHLMYNQYRKKNQSYFLNYIIQPKINIARLYRLIGNDDEHLKTTEQLHPKKIKILDINNLFFNIDQEHKFLLINNLIIEKFKYYYKLGEYKRILKKVEKYYYLCGNSDDLLNEIKFITLFKVDYEIAFKFCCEHINHCKKYLKNYWLLRICQCLKEMDNIEFLNNILDKICFEFLDQIKNDLDVFRINLSFFIELAKLCQICDRNLDLLNYFCFASNKIGDEKSELFFLSLINDNDKLHDAEKESIYSKQCDYKLYLNQINEIHSKFLNFIEERNAI